LPLRARLAPRLLTLRRVERTLDTIQADLVARGVEPALARRLAQAIEKRTAVLDAPRYQGVVAGVVLAVTAQRREVEQLRKAAGELGEVKRLLGSFTEEMKKLDEALETLAAYVVRMKNPQPPPSGRVLH
jgi:hypothetical protein